MRPIALCVLSLCLVACRDVPLRSALEEREANEVLSSLQRYDVRATKRAEGGEAQSWAVLVDREEFARANEICRVEGVPRERRQGMAALKGQELLALPSEQKDRAQVAKAQAEQVELALLAADGVIDARVVVALGGTDALGHPVPGTTTASVLLRLRRSDANRALTLEEIRRFAAGGVPGLTPERVVVTVVDAPPLPVSAALRTSTVLGVEVLPGSALPLRLALGFCALALLGLALLCGRLLAKVRRLERA